MRRHGARRLATVCANPEKRATDERVRQAVLTGACPGCCLVLRMTETDKLLALIASAIVAALFAHRYADLT